MLVTAFALAGQVSSAAEPMKPVELWPAGAPDETKPIGEEADLTKPDEGLIAGKRLIRLGNVSKPTITVYPAPAEGNTGTAVVVCPGGAYHILALDLEGSEVCEWLNSIGVTGILLKYRVPAREGRERHAAALQDVQRAMGLVREHAKEWGIATDRIGVLGFSAGGHLAAMLSTNYAKRSYERVDAADDLSCRPDFSVLIYPAYLGQKDKPSVLSEQLPVDGKTPPAFIAMTQDDPVDVRSAFVYSAALNEARVPVELHVYPKGGHGYGLRKTELPVTSWPDRLKDWLSSSQLLPQD
jgi:acetyl esterase/lipase